MSTVSDSIYGFKSNYLIIIVGAGLAGLAASIGIRRAGFRVLVLEQAAELQEVGAGIEVPVNAARVLKQWGLLEVLTSLAIQPTDLVIRSYRDGTALSKLNLIPDCEKNYGYRHLDLHRADFHTTLLNEATKLGVDIKLNSGVKSIDFSNMRVYTQSGEVYTADVVIGCDGEKSVCRDIICGESIPLRRSGRLAFRIVLDAEKLRQDKTLVDLLEPPNINAWFGPDSHAVSYLLKKDDQFNVFLDYPDQSKGDEIPDPHEVPISELRELYASWEPRIQRLLSIAENARKWALVKTGEILTWNHVAGKATLLGDAAHAMPPYMGQGAAMAMEDAAVLGTLFANCRHPTQFADVLSIFEQLRHPRTAEVRRLSREMKFTHGFVDGPLQQERDRQLGLEPYEGWPNVWGDPVLQKWLWGYDAFAEAHMAWERYLKGQFPRTGGFWNMAL